MRRKMKRLVMRRRIVTGEFTSKACDDIAQARLFVAFCID